MSKQIKILAIDGGGVKGVASAKFLEQLELAGNLTLYNKFDMIAGTSTGGLIALYIALKKATGTECVELFSQENIDRIMDKSVWDKLLPMQDRPKYDGVGKTKVITENFGNVRLGDLEKKVLVTAYDIVLRRIVVFKSFGGTDCDYNPTVAEVAEATSAAPTFFPTVKTSDSPPRWLIDGGMAANNPSMCALVEAMKMGYKPEEIKLLSIGTGLQVRGKDIADDIGKRSQKWGSVEWFFNGIMEHFFAANTSATTYHCQKVLGDNFLRVNGPLIYCSDDMDETKPGNVNNLQLLGKEWFKEFGHEALEFLK